MQRLLLALRSQLPRRNAFYGFEPSERSDASAEDEVLARCCPHCGLPADAAHERCATRAAAGLPCTFPEHELDIEPEAWDEEENLEYEKDLLEKYKANIAENKDEDMDESEVKAFEELSNETHVDAVFTQFEQKIHRDPDQVVRYEHGASPLWFSSAHQPKSGPGRCAHCQAERTFEFQVQPQLIALLPTDRLDFGVVAVFTCSDHCAIDTYLPEEVYVQPDTTA